MIDESPAQSGGRPFLEAALPGKRSAAKSRVWDYLDECVAEGRDLPSLGRIVRKCGCSRGSAQRYRNDWKAAQYDRLMEQAKENVPVHPGSAIAAPPSVW